MSEWKKAKNIRTYNYYKYEYKMKLQECGCCAGSGYYDDTNSPKCSNCNGTGKEKYRNTTDEQEVREILKTIDVPDWMRKY